MIILDAIKKSGCPMFYSDQFMQMNEIWPGKDMGHHAYEQL